MLGSPPVQRGCPMFAAPHQLPQLAPGAQLGAWRLVGECEAGGWLVSSADVARAWLRCLRPGLGLDGSLTERFLKDPWVAAEVHHPSVPRVLDVQVEHGLAYLVTTEVVGVPLARWAAGEGSGGAAAGASGPDLTARVRLLSSLADVLDVAHTAQLVHRDLNLDSCVVSPEGDLSVVDWGLARLRALAGLRPTFSAPERLAGRVLDERTDIYHLGAIAVALVICGESLTECLARPLSELTQRAPSELSELLEGCLAQRPEQRFQSARDAFRAARRALARLEQQRRTPAPRRAGAASESTQLRRAAVTEAALQSAPPSAASSAPRDRLEGPLASSPTEPQGRRARPLSPPPPATSGPPGSAPASPPERPKSAAQLRAALEASLPESTGWHPPDATRAKQAEAAAQARNLKAHAAAPQEVAAPNADQLEAPCHELTASRAVFQAWEVALSEMARRGAGHAEVTRRLDEAFGVIEQAMEGVDIALLWDVAPFALLLNGAVVWAPEEELSWLPYQLFADGVRVLGLSSGFTRGELASLSECLLASQGSDTSHDFTTLLWDADLEHVVSQTDDLWVGGTDFERAELERASAPWLLGSQGQRGFLEQSWRAAAGQPAGPGLTRLSALAEAGQSLRATLDAEVGELGRLSEVLEQEGDLGVGRFAYVAAVALRQAQRSGCLDIALGWLHRAGQTLSVHSPRAHWELVLSVLQALGKESLRKTARAQLITPSALAALLTWLDQSLLAPGGSAALGPFWQALTTELDESHAQHLAAYVSVAQSPELKCWLVEQQIQSSQGNERALVEAIRRTELAHGLQVVRRCRRRPSARHALVAACQHPEPLVRIEALAALEAPRLMLEVDTWLGGAEEATRLAALKGAGRHEVVAVVDGIVRRVESPSFDTLSREERSAALSTLAALAPERAEQVAVAVLERGPRMVGRGYEESCVLATRLLRELKGGESPKSSVRSLFPTDPARAGQGDRAEAGGDDGT